MHYVVRDPQGAIVSVHRDQVADSEALPSNHPEVQAFIQGEQGDGALSFARMDAGLVRVLEDLIDVLIRRGVLRITDLPTEAQAKLFDRKHFRSGLQAHALSLYEEGEGASLPTLAVHPNVGNPEDQLPPKDWPDLL